MSDPEKPHDPQDSTLKIDNDGNPVREIRCFKCRAWLADEYIYEGRLILKCRRCKEIVKINFKHAKNGRRN